MEKKYQPQKYEDKIYQQWEKSGYFNPDKLETDEKAEKYSIMMPPANVTGHLHMGHAMMLAIEDILIRYHRMKGDRTLWLPGTDHAAIATQAKVEKILKEKNQTRHDLGRKNFLKEVNKFAQDSHNTIVRQIKKMGASCDWSREAYTLDKTRHQAVYSVFKMMYEDGLIYQGERIVNWCPSCHSTLADDEVEYKKENARLYWIKYGPFVLATSRPETKLGDTAVAVHPEDKRYKKMIGKKYKISGVLGEFEIKVVADKLVDPEFGSGAIKVTPAHSFIDNEIAQRHKLPMKKIINGDGKMMKNCGKYAGLTTKEARQAIVRDMEKMGLIDHIDENYQHNTAVCYRCGATIEPLPSKQWFIDMNKKIPKYKKSLKELSIEAVEKGVFGQKKIKIHPHRFEKIYYHWMKNLRDWCISRQIWFGHRIPVWYKKRPINLTLVRHAQTDWNKQHIMQGQTDIPLNEKGKQQAKDLRKIITEKNINTIIISPLKRTRQTAEILNDKNLEIIEDERLKERYYGKFEGQKTEDLLKNHPEIKTFEVAGCPYWVDVPTAETYDELRARVKDFVEDVKSKYGGKNILIVSHGDTLDMFYAVLNETSNEEAYGKFSLNGTVQNYKIEGREIYVDTKKPKQEDNFVFLHAFKANSKEDFWPWLKNKLNGSEIFLEDLPKPFNPDLKEQMNFVLNKTKINENTTIVGHSLGCVLAMKMLAEKKLKIKKLILVAPPLQPKKFVDNKKRPPLEKYCDWKFNFKKIKELADDILVFADKEDPVLFMEDPEKITEKLSAEIIKLNKGNRFCSPKFEELLEKLQRHSWQQDLDTLDTWFSSGLWTFSTLAKKPEQIKIKNGKLKINSQDFKDFHPSSLMETGYDILFFWVARMIIMTTYAVENIPFQDVYLHGLVLDKKGKKMSKSKGNVLDPLDMCKKYGTDAARLSLIIGTAAGNDIKISEKKIEGQRNLVNKLWNIARFILEKQKNENKKTKNENITMADAWILEKTGNLIDEVSADLENYNFSAGAEKLREFTWNDLANWYVEASKFENNKKEKAAILNMIMEDLLKLWHPFAPFVTEKIWEAMENKKMLIISAWPDKNKYKEIVSSGSTNPVNFEKVMEIIKAIRNARTEYQINPKEKIEVIIYSEKFAASIQSQENLMKNLRTGVKKITVQKNGKKIPKAFFKSLPGVELYMPLENVIDIEKEAARLQKELNQAKKQLASLEKKLANKKFIANAPLEVVKKEKNKFTVYKNKISEIKEQLNNIK